MENRNQEEDTEEKDQMDDLIEKRGSANQKSIADRGSLSGGGGSGMGQLHLFSQLSLLFFILAKNLRILGPKSPHGILKTAKQICQ